MTQSSDDESAHADMVDDRYTDGLYLAENADWGEGDAAWKAGQIARMLQKHDLRPESICDIGCGTGGVLDNLGVELGDPPELVGYEVSAHALRLAPAGRRERIELIHGPYDIDDRTFDLLVCMDVLEHLEDYYGFLRGLRRKAPWAMFHIPIDTAVTSVLQPGPIARSYSRVGHIQHFTKAAVRGALRHAGYEIVDCEHTVPARVARVSGPRQRIGQAARLATAAINVDLAARLMTGFPLLVLCRT